MLAAACPICILAFTSLVLCLDLSEIPPQGTAAMSHRQSAQIGQIDFSDAFKALTGQTPFPWQETLYERFVTEGDRNVPASCNLPTGLGKTSVIAIWLIALATHSRRMPRRLAYVVNRRTVVDQTTYEVEKLRERLKNPGQDSEHAPALISLKGKLSKLCSDQYDVPLAISTLRGQFADNREWSADPARPAVICGTVDMIGSRLLFSGYGVGFKAKPLHAGFLGQDVLLVHDEAHLEPAFQKLIEQIDEEQQRERSQSGDLPWPKLRVMELTATSRNGGDVFGLTDKDRENDTVKKRIGAKKSIRLHKNKDDEKLGDEIGDLAVMLHKDSGQAILIFVRKVEDIDKVAGKLPKGSFEQLTGTLRGLERDGLVKTPIFQRFLAPSNRDTAIPIAEGTVYLVCTSAGEVGIDISADHMVCDLSTFDSMAQRFGRVNRYGDCPDSRIDVMHPIKFDDKDKLASACKATLDLLGSLEGDASPKAVGALLGSLPEKQRKDAFAPSPTIVPATDILFDAWALTSIREKIPGRPPVEPYLHGLADWQPRETYVAWREEVEIVTGELLEQYSPANLLDEYPLKPHELLRDRSDRVFDKLQTLAAKRPTAPVWLVDEQGKVDPGLLTKLADPSASNAAARKPLIARIEGCTVLLPPSAGGLSGGMLDGSSDKANDVADIEFPATAWRLRLRSDDAEYDKKIAGMRLVQSFDLTHNGESNEVDEQQQTWDWYKGRPLEDVRTAQKPVLWDIHVGDVVRQANNILAGLSLSQEIAQAIRVAAKLHDHGKRRLQFQFTLGNRKYPKLVLAKSGHIGARLPETYRHEFGSLADAMEDAEFQQLSQAMKDLVLHLIAAHHGRARPHFPADEAFDPERLLSGAEALAVETPRRFAQLQRKYGRWGLAYLESLLRAADWAASAAPSVYADEPEAKS